ncbi:MAG TPA: MATE family efflux transporter [Solibacterales bacterium]|nr:MATE family efflux transporter [Bryobacterales bacterium]
MFALAAPVVLAEMGWSAMSMVDTLMVGRLGAEAIGAVAVGSIAHFGAVIFGMGLLLGLDTLVAQAYGARRFADCHRALLQGVYVSLALAPLLMLAVWGLRPLLGLVGINPRVLPGVLDYLNAVNFSTLPLLLYASFRRYLQAMNEVRPVMFALLSANLVNVAGNWVLIFGHWGAPAMGAEGAGWATCVSRLYMAGVLTGYAVLRDRHNETGLFRVGLRPDGAAIRRLLQLGLPAALQLWLEVGAFGTATALAGRLEPAALAAHQIALNLASFTYMAPLGISSAAAVRVGHAVGRGDTRGARRAGWTAVFFGAAFMSVAGLVFLLAPRPLLRAFTSDANVIATGAGLLFLCALFQLFDGLQVVTTGALRGAGETRTPMLMNLVGHWLIGLPMGYALAFPFGLGVHGLWVGLSLGLIVVGAVLLAVWAGRARRGVWHTVENLA